MKRFQEVLQGFWRCAGVLLPLECELEGKGKTAGVFYLVLYHNLELWFHGSTFSDCEGRQIRKKLVGMALEQESFFITGSSEQLFLCVEKVQLDNYIPRWAICLAASECPVNSIEF